MKSKKSKINVKGRVQNPKPKSLQIKSLRAKTPKSKPYAEKRYQIREDIMSLKVQRRQIITDLEKCIQRIKNLPISLSGIESLSDESINQIQDKRNKESMNLVNQTGDFAVSTRKLGRLERKYRKYLKC